MASRIENLTDAAQPFAKELVSLMGSLKRVKSAGIMALWDHNPEMRQYYMAKAAGLDVVKPQPQAPESEQELVRRLTDHMQEIGTLLKIAPKRTPPKKRRSGKTQ